MPSMHFNIEPSASYQSNGTQPRPIDSRTRSATPPAGAQVFENMQGQPGLQGLLALGAEMERLADALIANGKAPAGVTRADLLKLGHARLQQLNAQAVNEFDGYSLNAMMDRSCAN